MAEYSHKISRPQNKGGLSNILYIHASLESLPEELVSLASELTIFFPWGSLLLAVIGQAPTLLKNIGLLCKPKAKLRIIFSLDPSIEHTLIKNNHLPQFTQEYLKRDLKKLYQQAGFEIHTRHISKNEILIINTAWAKKLAFGRERQFIEILGKKIGDLGLN